jgi:hypothetical protein
MASERESLLWRKSPKGVVRVWLKREADLELNSGSDD